MVRFRITVIRFIFAMALLPVLSHADTLPVDSCSNQYPGDVNSDGVIDSLDLAFMWDYLNWVGPAPSPLANADPSGNCYITYSDYIMIRDFIVGGQAPVVCTCNSPEIILCHWGDSDGNGLVTISDAVLTLNYIFAGGIPPLPFCNGDINCDCIISISDCIVMINAIFAGGSIPENCQGIDDWLDACGR